VLLTRPQAEVRVTVIPASAGAFLSALSEGNSLASASEAIITDFPDFDPGAALVGLSGLGAFAAIKGALT
jgi:hypothetical protein